MRRPGLRWAGGNHTGRSRYNEHTGHNWKPGDHWVDCQRCGFHVRESNARREWSGAVVCEGCFDFRHPQDFVRAGTDDTAAKGLVRSESPDEFGTHEDTPFCPPNARAGIAIAGCAIAGWIAETPIGDTGGYQINPADSGSPYSTFDISDPIG